MNQSHDFSLGLENFRDIPFQKYENNFTFIVNGKKYQTNRLIADILSPNIKKMHFSDPTADKYYIKVDDDNYFSEFLSLVTNQTMKLDSSSEKFFSNYFYQLGNINEFIKIFQDSSSQELISDNAISQLLSIISIENKSGNTIYSNNESIKKIISFIAIHFEEINKDIMKKLNIETLYEILQNKELKINSEDSLFEFILSLYEIDTSYSVLFEFILFNNLSQKSFEKFIDKVEFEDINLSIWKSICSRFCAESNEINSNRYNNYIININYDKSNKFNGIFNYLTNQTKGNIVENGTIKISSNSYINENYHPKNIVDFNNSLSFRTSHSEGTMKISIDLKDKQVQLSGYSFQSNLQSFCLDKFTVEVSNDEKSWEVVDEHSNDFWIQNGKISSFKIKQKVGFFRFIQLRLKCPVSLSEDPFACVYIGLTNFEIYGQLKLQ